VERIPSRGDVALAVAAAVFCVSGAALAGLSSDEPELHPLAVLLLVAQCLPLMFRRHWPLAVWVACGVAAGAYGIADFPDPAFPVGAFVSLAAVVEFCSRRTAALAWCVSAAASVLTLVLSGDSDAVDVWMVVMVLVAAPLLGDRQRARSAYLAELQANAEQVARAHQVELETAKLAERQHLARELHDVVAHHVSMIVVQAEAGASAQPQSAPAFDAIAATGRRTLGELRALLGVLRTGSQAAAPTAPHAGIDQLEDLVRAVPEQRLHVDLAVEGVPRPLAPAVDLSAYRVVQEALTNVVKHAGARNAAVTVRYDPTCLRITVADDGAGAGDARASNGHGLDGLRERVSLLGGSFDAGPRTEGGFALDVRLPMDPA
jgi:signal transduction histidine kinase